MYLPASFRENDISKLHSTIQQYNFATLITQHEGTPFGTHLPLYLRNEPAPYGNLVGHMARANPQWRDFDENQEVLVIFQGPHAYITPSWYEVELSVPTWNYVAIHAYGKPRLIQDAKELYSMLKTLVNHHEAGFENPWPMDLPQDYMNNMMKAIVGFEIEITRLEGKFKLSQNRSENDQHHVAAALAQSDDYLSHGVAALMGNE